MNNKIKIIALFGKSGSGKDSIQKWVENYLSLSTKGIISYTTRPRRDYEIDKKDYYFINDLEFSEKIVNDIMLEYSIYNNWYYGTSIENLDKKKINIGVFNIKGIESLLNNPNIEVIPIYIKASDKTRLIRNLTREKNPNCDEICRRYFTDKEDFSKINFNYYSFDNNNKDYFSSNLNTMAQYIYCFKEYYKKLNKV